MAEDPLAPVMVDLQAQGMTLGQIAARTGLTEAQCHARIQDYLDSSESSLSVTQLRKLQRRRLERIMAALDEQVQAGDLLTQGKNVKNLIDAIEQITELEDLKKDRLRDEQVRLTQAQTLMILDSMGLLQAGMLPGVLEWLAGRLPPQMMDGLREDFTVWWNEQFPSRAADAVEQRSSAMVQMGTGAGPVELMTGESDGQS